MDEPSLVWTNAIMAAVSALFFAFLSMLGWQGRKISTHVDDLKERTARLEATAVDLEDIRRVLREEVGIHIRDGDRRITHMENSIEKLSVQFSELQRTVPRRVGDKADEGSRS